MSIWLCRACATRRGGADDPSVRTRATPVSSHDDSIPRTFIGSVQGGEACYRGQNLRNPAVPQQDVNEWAHRTAGEVTQLARGCGRNAAKNASLDVPSTEKMEDRSMHNRHAHPFLVGGSHAQGYRS